MEKRVILYTQETCSPCQEEKLWLKQNGIEFEERDIRKNPTFLDEIVDLGAAATPVTIVKTEENENIVYGFDKEQLKQILNL